jgi:hypothetical protein
MNGVHIKDKYYGEIWASRSDEYYEKHCLLSNDSGKIFLRNVSKQLQDYMAANARREYVYYSS